MTAHLGPSLHDRAALGTSPFWSRRRGVAVLLALGGCFMLGRTVMLIAGGALTTYQPWAAALLTLEFLVDGVAVALLVRWLVTGDEQHQAPALRGVAAVILVHAVRVLVFVLGRTGPWVDFDVRPRHRMGHSETWSWAGVWFAGIMALSSVVVLVIVMGHRRRSLRRSAGRAPVRRP
jgi:hypothetical protein